MSYEYKFNVIKLNIAVFFSLVAGLKVSRICVKDLELCVVYRVWVLVHVLLSLLVCQQTVHDALVQENVQGL